MKRTLSFILALVLLFAAIPFAAGAAESDIADTGAIYDVWVGSTRVSDVNKDDILGDGGKAKFDPSTNTLTLNDPKLRYYNIVNVSQLDRNFNTVVYAKNMDLTVKGSYYCREDNQDMVILDGGTLTLSGSYRLGSVYSMGDLRLKNIDLSLRLKEDRYVNNAIYTLGDLYFDSGSLDVRGVCGAYEYNSLIYSKGSFIVSPDIDGLSVYKGVDDSIYLIIKDTRRIFGRGIYAEQNIILPDSLRILKPENGYADGKEICPDDEWKAQKIEIINSKIKLYDLWVGDTQVTDLNRNDILGDGGKAKFDPAASVLTLNEPVISDFYQNTSGNSEQIYCRGMDLTVVGSYHMSADADAPINGIEIVEGDLTLNGDFSFFGQVAGVYVTTPGQLTVAGGSLEARRSGDDYISFGIYAGGNISLLSSADSVIAEGSRIAITSSYGSITAQSPLSVTYPEGCQIIGGGVYESDGVTKAKYIEIFNTSKICTVRFDPGEGYGYMKPERVDKGSFYTLPKCTFGYPAGKKFKGWSFDGSVRQPGDEVIVNDDCTLTAIWWTPCTVSFDPNGGSGSMEPVTLEKGSSYTLPECTFTPPEGKVFDSWRVSGIFATQAPGSTITVSADKTVEAVWKNASAGTYSISGSVTSFLSDTDRTTITLSKKSGDNYVVKGEQTVTGNSASYIFNDISRMSQYKLTVRKKNHVEREYTVTILVNSKTVDVKICPIGDVNGDGSVTNFDYSKVNQHVCKIEGKELTDYAFACADVNKDGSVTNFDAGKINQHVCKVKSLFAFDR